MSFRSENPTTELMLVRTVIEAGRLAPTVGHLTDALTSGSYGAALDHLADLQLRIGHMATIVTIMRDWEPANIVSRNPRRSRSDIRNY
jgi:hypothetical protein